MASYYVSNNGSDANPGTISEAFATPEHAHSVALAGDTIYLQRGSRWFGFTPQKAGSSGNPIVWNAYGGGVKPVIHGFQELTGWTAMGGGFWKVTDAGFPSRIHFLLIDGILKTVARWPRENYYRITGATGSTTGTISDTVNLSGRDFNGGEVVARKNAWIIDVMTITGHSGTTLNFSGGSSYNVQTNWGYLVQNHPDCCTEALDWYQDGNEVVVYFGGEDPADYMIHAPVLERIDFISRGHNTFRNIVFEGFNGGPDRSNENPCILVGSSPNLIFELSCEFNRMGNTVFYFTSSNNNGFTLNGILGKECLNVFFWNRFTAATPIFNIIGCDFEDIGHILGASGNGDSAASCIQFGGSANPATIVGNRLNRIGYKGISYGGFQFLIENNRVEQACYIKADGGCFYIFGKSDVSKTYDRNLRILRKNIGINSPGNAYGTSTEFSSGIPAGYFSEAFYFDDDSKEITVIDNIGTGCRAGIKVQNNRNHIFSGNLFYKNTVQVLFANNNNGDFDIENIDFQNNLLYADAGQLVAQFESKNFDFNIFGTFDNNYYMRPANESSIIRHLKTGTGGFDNLLSLAAWKSTDLGGGTYYDQNTVGTPTGSTVSLLLINDTHVDNVPQDILRRRMDRDGEEVTELFLDAFEADLLLDDLGPLAVNPDPDPVPTPSGIWRGKPFVLG